MRSWTGRWIIVHAALCATVLAGGCDPSRGGSALRPQPVNPQGRPQAPAAKPKVPDTPDLPPGTPDGPAPAIPPVTTPVEPGVPEGAKRLLGTVNAPSAILSNNGSGIISNNGSAILSNNGSGIISNNGSAIISNNGSAYRVMLAAGAEGTLAGAFLYLTNRDEKFFFNAETTRPFAALSDAQGRWGFTITEKSAFPVGQDVIVNAVTNGNMRLTGYMVPTAEGGELKINLATTLATEFLRGEAYRLGKGLGAFDAAGFREAVALTDEAIAKGDIEAIAEVTASGAAIKVGTFDLRMDRVHDLRNQYAIALSVAAKGNTLMKQLSDAWKQLLGARPAAVTTVIGNGGLPQALAIGPADEPRAEGDGAAPKSVPLGFASGVAVSARGDVFVSTYTEAGNSGHIRWIKPNGAVSTIWLPTYPLVQPQGIAIEKQPSDDVANDPGMLLVADLQTQCVYRVPIVDQAIRDAASGNEKWPTTIVAGEATPLYATPFYDPFAPIWGDGYAPVSSASADRSRWRLAEEGPRTYVTGTASDPEWPGPLPVVGPGDPVPSPARYAHLSRPVGVAVDELGNIYIAELGNHRIRMVVHPDQDGQNFFKYRAPVDDGDGIPDGFAGSETAMAGGAIYTIAGNPAWDTDRTPDDGAGRWFGEYADSDGVRAQLAKLDQPAGLAFRDGHLYVADYDNQRIRRISRATGVIETFAGAPPATQRGGGTDFDYAPGYAGDGGPATSARLAYPRSIAFDAQGRCYIADSDNGRIRMVDGGGRIQSVAGRYHDPAALPTDNVTDGEALRWADLYDTQFLAVDPDGNVLLTDVRHRRVRKVWRQWE